MATTLWTLMGQQRSRSPDELPASLHGSIWRAMLKQIGVVAVELSAGPVLLGVELGILTSYAPHLLAHFHWSSALAVGVILGCRLGLLLFAVLTSGVVTWALRRRWRYLVDRMKVFDDHIKPTLQCCKLLAAVQSAVVITVCAHAFKDFWDGLERPDVVAVLPILGLAETAGVLFVFEFARLDHWIEALWKLHELPKGQVVVKVPVQRRIFQVGDLDESCCICLSDFEAGEALAELQCRHAFHETCIKSWVCEKDSCPLRCDIGSVRCYVHCSPRAAGLNESPELQVGDCVKVRTSQTESWKLGTVVSTLPLLVRPDGWLHGYAWESVQPAISPDGTPRSKRGATAIAHEHVE